MVIASHHTILRTQRQAVHIPLSITILVWALYSSIVTLSLEAKYFFQTFGHHSYKSLTHTHTQTFPTPTSVENPLCLRFLAHDALIESTLTHAESFPPKVTNRVYK